MPFTESYFNTAEQDAGAVAELAAGLKSQDSKVHCGGKFVFQPVAVELFGLINCLTVSFLSGRGWRIAEVSGEIREGSFLFQ